MEKWYGTPMVVLISLAFSHAPAVAQKPANEPQNLARAGQIVGELECYDGSVLEGALVHIPGDSLGSWTDATGRFRLRYVVEGTYTLQVHSLGWVLDPARPAALYAVDVVAKKITDLGPIVMTCPGEKFSSAKNVMRPRIRLSSVSTSTRHSPGWTRCFVV